MAFAWWSDHLGLDFIGIVSGRLYQALDSIMKVFAGIHKWIIKIGFLVVLIGNGSACNIPTPINQTKTIPTSILPSQVINIPLDPIQFSVTEEGVYEFSLDDLKKAGIILGDIDPNHLRLLNRGIEKPLWLFNSPQGFVWRFYANSLDNPYTSKNIYILEFRGGEVIDTTNLAIPTPTESSYTDVYTYTHKAEQNRHYVPQVEAGDPWMWIAIPGQKEEEFELVVDHFVVNKEYQPALCIHIWAGTEAQVSPDHHLIASVNHQQIFDKSWDGRGRQTFCGLLPENSLTNGYNTIQLKSPGDTGAPADVINVDWIELTYPRFLTTAENSLTFVSRGLPQQLSGFEDKLFIYDVTDKQNPRTLGVATIDITGAAVFQGLSGHTYLAVSTSGVKKPEISLSAITPDLRAFPNGADYLIIGSSDLLNAMNELVEFRQEQGLTPLLVPVEAVYDQFGDGFPEPEAIQKFLKYAYTNWSKTPRWVLLVGDATYDPKGYQSSPVPYSVPTFYIYTEYGGITASDVIYTMLDGDNEPDVALGRLPVRTLDELRNVVKKIINYESRLEVGGSKRLFVIADGQEPIFVEDARDFLSRFSDQYSGILFSPQPGTTNATEEILRYINDGVWLVAYFGHGSLTMWGKDRLFINEDVVQLTNRDKLPVIINMSCLTGYFIHPKVQSITEAFLLAPQDGAVAMIAPTSLTLPVDQNAFSHALADAITRNTVFTLGEIVLSAQRQLTIDEVGSRDVLLTYLLFGDPALRFPGLQP